ncbi:hypothetical protein PGTUg99_027508 [Puccinia graminis f. sp. tritici]|uniref:Uncharacterized protein n=1 Tax=Puccinia graminis f. sp. tritici TaxID=56615 RepID=A0A5B0PPI7_PUCGR|nr:hypothetical protein PGTUg99_027508 [Puccinia graminis f. sp. tritici]
MLQSMPRTLVDLQRYSHSIHQCRSAKISRRLPTVPPSDPSLLEPNSFGSAKLLRQSIAAAYTRRASTSCRQLFRCRLLFPILHSPDKHSSAMPPFVVDHCPQSSKLLPSISNINRSYLVTGSSSSIALMIRHTASTPINHYPLDDRVVVQPIMADNSSPLAPYSTGQEIILISSDTDFTSYHIIFMGPSDESDLDTDDSASDASMDVTSAAPPPNRIATDDEL